MRYVDRSESSRMSYTRRQFAVSYYCSNPSWCSRTSELVIVHVDIFGCFSDYKVGAPIVSDGCVLMMFVMFFIGKTSRTL